MSKEERSADEERAKKNRQIKAREQREWRNLHSGSPSLAALDQAEEQLRELRSIAAAEKGRECT